MFQSLHIHHPPPNPHPTPQNNPPPQKKTTQEELEGRTANGDPVPGIDLSAAGILGAEATANLFASPPPSAGDAHAATGAAGAAGAAAGEGMGPSSSSHEMGDRLLASTLQRLQAPIPAPAAMAASDGGEEGEEGEHEGVGVDGGASDASYSCRYSDFSYCDLESSQTLMDRVVIERAATRAAVAAGEAAAAVAAASPFVGEG